MSSKTNYNTQQKVVVNEFGEVEMLEPSRLGGFTFYDSTAVECAKLEQDRISNIPLIGNKHYIEMARKKGFFVNKALDGLTECLEQAASFSKRTEAISAEIQFLQKYYL